MRAALILLAMSLASLATAHDAVGGPEPVSIPQLMEAFGWDLEATEIRSQTITEGLHVLYGLGGNIAVSNGKDGTLIVDDQFPELIPQIRKAIRKLGGDKKVAFAINTHWHFDHAAGNLALGPKGTWLVAQSNSRTMMQQENVINLVVAAGRQEAYPDEALPVITFDESMQFHFNDEQIELLHFGPAHTTGDAAVLFRRGNAVHMGDVFNNAGYPFIDVGNGGSLDGVIAFCRQVLARINEQTTVIPGHGPISDHAGFLAYIQMLETLRSRIAALIEQGASLEEVIAAKPSADYDERYGRNTIFLNRAYASLSRR